MISSIWNVLDQNLDSSATFVNLIVDILEEDKKNDLLSAWNGFKIEVRTSSSIIYTGGLWLRFAFSNAANSQSLFRPLLGQNTRALPVEGF